MTELLYYHDSYAVQFRATVIERLDVNGLIGLVLDRTYFYPTSGGQPHDLGLIDHIAVREVRIRDEDEAVLHLLSETPQEDEVQGMVDWSRRFDHMQQHSGQHILSQAFVQVADANTVGFHMSAESSTVDLDASSLTDQDIREAERLANEVVWQDRPVTVRFVTHAEARELPLRKLPAATKDDLLRLVAIDSFDLSACGGTHVSRTGEVGTIKVVKVERMGGKSRIEFLCGGRALVDYDRKHQILDRLSNEMTTGYWEVENTFSRLRDDLKQANRKLKQQSAQLAGFEAENLAKNAARYGETSVIRQAFEEREPQELRRLASQLTGHGNRIVLFGLAGDKAQLLFARSDDVVVPVNDVLAEVLPVLGEASGGGSEKFAQGGGPSKTIDEVAETLQASERIVRRLLADGQAVST